MKATFNLLIISVLSCLFTSCYTLNTHQSGKTLGKGNVSVQAISGLVGTPRTSNDPNHEDMFGVSLLQLQAVVGVGEKFDLGVTAGYAKLGFQSKYQIVGHQESKFALSAGTYLYKSEGSGYDFMNMVGFEVPVFMSFHPTETIAFYSNPMLTYFSVEGEGLVSIFEKPFYQTGVYKGLSSGMIFTIPTDWRSVALVTSLDVSWLSPLESNRYIFFTTVGIGVKLPKGWLKRK